MKLKHLISPLASASVMWYALPWLMFVLILGTIAQKDIGLFAATQIFFHSPVLWFGVIPFPGVPVVLGVMSLALAGKLFFKSPWSLQTGGIIITHIGVLILLFGGAYVALSIDEGFVVLDQGQTKSYMSAYHTRVFEITDGDGQVLSSFDFDTIDAGAILRDPALPFSITAQHICRNCSVIEAKDSKLSLVNIPLEAEDEANQAGITLNVRGANPGQTQSFFVYEPLPEPPKIRMGDAVYAFHLRRAQRDLPFDIRLEAFNKVTHPGSQLAKSYQSKLTILEPGGVSWPAEISMNNPLRYKGYTFYQSSFVSNADGTEASVLSIVKSRGRTLPYIASFIIGFGLLWHVAVRAKNLRRSKNVLSLLLGLIFLSLSSHAGAQTHEQAHEKTFQKIPVLHEGRIKPMDSVARLTLSRICECRSIKDMAPDEWLLQVIRDPASTAELEQFYIGSQDLRQRLGLPNRPSKRYSYTELAPQMQKQMPVLMQLLNTPESEWSKEQTHLYNLQNNIALFEQISGSFTAFLPLEAIPSSPSYYALKSQGLDNQTDFPLLKALESSGQDNVYLKVIPDIWDARKKNWLSPWQSLSNAFVSSDVQKLLDGWSGFIQGDAGAIQNIYETTLALRSDQIQPFKLGIELWINRYDPLVLSVFFFGFSALLSLVSVKHKRFSKPAYGLHCLGCILLGLTIAARCIILERPPVGTLYESVLFVTFILGVAGFIWALRVKSPLTLLPASLMSGALLLAAGGLLDGSDHLTMLTAVLNTNFWLVTHVLVITGGYALSIVAALAGHLVLGSYALGRKQNSGFSILVFLTVAALLWMSVGTLLGGVWADYSWGRFWGWDPKENGALLIVLWLAWILHGRIAGKLDRFGFAALAGALNIVVAFSWFGVNLLNVGLHSYGFIEGIAFALFGFAGVQAMILAGLYYYAYQRHKKANA